MMQLTLVSPIIQHKLPSSLSLLCRHRRFNTCCRRLQYYYYYYYKNATSKILHTFPSSRNIIHHYTAVSQTLSWKNFHCIAQQEPQQQLDVDTIQIRRRMNTSAVSADSKNNNNNNNHIVSQQRIKRFYKHVDVVEITTSHNHIHNIPYPQLPPPQLIQPLLPVTVHSDIENHHHHHNHDIGDTFTTNHNNNNNNNNNTTTSTSKEEEKWYTITLDGKSLRTPLGKILVVPSISLAHMIAIEWNSVMTQIIPNQMPMMTYVCTVLDQVIQHKEQYELWCYQYVLTDTLGYPANNIHEPILYQQQQKSWLPIQLWIQSSFIQPSHLSLSLPSVLLPKVSQRSHTNNINNNNNMNHNSKTNALLSSLSNTNNNSLITQKIPYDPIILKSIQEYISKLDVWYLLALYIGCKECKSFWLSCALLHSHTNHHRNNNNNNIESSSSSSLQVTPEQIQIAARIEEEQNIEDWGLVEGQHDYDRLNASIQIRSIALFVQSLNTQ